jgi:hypothetical protein
MRWAWNNVFELDRDGQQTIQAIGFEIQVERVRCKDLVLPSGELMVFDPIAHPEAEPISVAFPRGTHPVFLVLADLREERKLAFVTVHFSDAPVSHWSSALVSDDGSEEEIGLRVESSLLGLMDNVLAHPWLTAISIETAEECEHRLFRCIRRQGASWHGAYSIVPQHEEKMLVVAVEPGLFSVRVGRDVDNQVVMLVCDFGVLDYHFRGSLGPRR